MRRYWVTLEDSDYEKLEKMANSRGVSIGSLSKEIIVAFLGKDSQNNAISIEKLVLSMKEQMDNMTSESNSFIVRDMIPEWASLSRSDKMICSKALARLVAENDDFDVVAVKAGVNYYKHK